MTKLKKFMFQPLYVFLWYFFDSSANQSNYTVGDNHPVDIYYGGANGRIYRTAPRKSRPASEKN